MKLILQKVREKPYEVDIDPNSTVEDLEKILINEYSMKEGIYMFIYHGKILKNPKPFANLPENAHIIIFFKEREKRVNRVQQDLIQHLTNILNESLIEQLYNPRYSFWENPDKVQQIHEICNNNPEAIRILMLFMRKHFGSALRFSGAKIGTSLAIIGNRLTSNTYFDDHDAALQQLTNKERADFKKLVNEGFDSLIALEAFIENGYNYEATREFLQSIFSSQ